MEIPQGWHKVEEGVVQLGDKIWVPAFQLFTDVNEKVLDLLGFMDARPVGECFCVIREK